MADQDLLTRIQKRDDVLRQPPMHSTLRMDMVHPHRLRVDGGVEAILGRVVQQAREERVCGVHEHSRVGVARSES